MALDHNGCCKSTEVSQHKDNAIEQYPDGIFVPTVAKQVSIERGRTEPDGEVGRVKLVYSNYKNLFILSGSETEVVIPKTKQKGLPTELFIWHPWEEGKQLTVSWDKGVTIDGVAGPSSLVLRYSAWLHVIRDKGDNWVTVSIENINDTLLANLAEGDVIVAEMDRLQGLVAADREQTGLDRIATGQDRAALSTLRTEILAVQTNVNTKADIIDTQNDNVNTKHGEVVTMNGNVNTKHTEVLDAATQAEAAVVQTGADRIQAASYKDASNAARIEAENARDAASAAVLIVGAFTAPTISDAITAGLAATTVGQYFTATGGDVDYIITYRHLSGGVAGEISRQAVFAYVAPMLAVRSGVSLLNNLGMLSSPDAWAYDARVGSYCEANSDGVMGVVEDNQSVLCGRGTQGHQIGFYGDFILKGAGQLRHDNSDGVRRLLVEPSATNLLRYSAANIAGGIWMPLSSLGTAVDLALNAMDLFNGVSYASSGAVGNVLRNASGVPLEAGPHRVTAYYRRGTSPNVRLQIKSDTPDLTSDVRGEIGGVVKPSLTSAGAVTDVTQRLMPDGLTFELSFVVNIITTATYYLQIGPQSAILDQTIIALGGQITTGTAKVGYIHNSGNVTTTRSADDVTLNTPNILCDVLERRSDGRIRASTKAAPSYVVEAGLPLEVIGGWRQRLLKTWFGERGVKFGCVFDKAWLDTNPAIERQTFRESAIAGSNADFKQANMWSADRTIYTTDGDEFVARCNNWSIPYHLHTLTWYKSTPTWQNDTTVTAATWEGHLAWYIQQVMSRYNPVSVDVCNELFAVDGSGYREDLWYLASAGAYIERAFELSRQYNASAKRFLCEFDIEFGTQKYGHLLSLLSTHSGKNLIQGVNIQGHANISRDWDWLRLERRFREMTDLGYTVNISEFDTGSSVEYSEVEYNERCYDTASRYIEAWLKAGCGDTFMTWGVNSQNTAWSSLQPTITQYAGLPLNDDGSRSRMGNGLIAGLNQR